jgi:hypothetical protein
MPIPFELKRDAFQVRLTRNSPAHTHNTQYRALRKAFVLLFITSRSRQAVLTDVVKTFDAKPEPLATFVEGVSASFLARLATARLSGEKKEDEGKEEVSVFSARDKAALSLAFQTVLERILAAKGSTFAKTNASSSTTFPHSLSLTCTDPAGLLVDLAIQCGTSGALDTHAVYSLLELLFELVYIPNLALTHTSLCSNRCPTVDMRLATCATASTR